MEGNAMKQEALKLSDEIGVKNAAKQLSVAHYTLADASPTIIASGSIRATRLACCRCATGRGRRLTGRTPLSRHTPSAFQILGVPRLHIS